MNFFELTPDEILQGLDIIHDSSCFQEALNNDDPLVAFGFDIELQRLAFLWLECGQDMVLTRLRYE